MDHIEIPEEQVVTLDSIAPGVAGLRIAFVNVFAITHPSGAWTLIDAAIPFSHGRIRRWAETLFSTPPNAIVLTHGHFDHVSAAPQLAEDWDVPVYAHPLEFPYLSGQREYPEPNVGAGGGLMSLLSPLYPRKPIDLGIRLRALPPEGEELPILPGWQLLHTPGHTPGHVSFWRSEDQTLLVGDAFCTTKPESFFDAAIAQAPELHGPPSYFTSDWEQARLSVSKLAALGARTVAPGHGKPLAGPGVGSAIEKLASDFDRVAVPSNQHAQIA